MATVVHMKAPSGWGQITLCRAHDNNPHTEIAKRVTCLECIKDLQGLRIRRGVAEAEKEEPRQFDLQIADKVQVGGEHYVDMHHQPWAIIEEWRGIEALEEALILDVIQYILREKSGETRITRFRKAGHCLSKIIELETKLINSEGA